MPVNTPVCEFGWKAPDFELSDIYGKTRSLQTLRGENGLLIMFICQHCPYVKTIIERLVADAREVQKLGVCVAAIMSNDVHAYPEDSFANMLELAKTHQFSFPYLYDPTQEVARMYNAACTPDFFGFNRDLELQYRGRLDSAGMGAAGPDTRRELVEAMRMIATTGQGPREQTPSMGCSIKWRTQ